MNSNERRLSHLHKAPLRGIDRDLLQSVEQRIRCNPGYPDLTCFSSVFTKLDVDNLSKLTACGDLLSAIVALLNTKLDPEFREDHREELDGAIWIYQGELHRILTNRINASSPFWHLFNKRQSPLRHTASLTTHTDRYTMYCIPLDAAYYMNYQRGQLAYEMLAQSFLSIAKGLDPSVDDEHTNAAFKTALRLVQGFNLPCISQWIQQLMINHGSLHYRKTS